MSVQNPVPTRERRDTVIVVRPARAQDRSAIRRIIRDAYREYADQMPRTAFRSYLSDLLDLDAHDRLGTLLAAEVDGRVCGFAAFYPDASLQGLGWPAGWAGGRALAVARAARHHGVARALVAECERLAGTVGAPVFAFHSASFMTRALALYDELGYDRMPAYDLDVSAMFGALGSDPAHQDPVTAVAFGRYLT
jgi:GNAT superfamily N-acetyltransferase